MLETLDHLIVFVRDLERATATYSGLLGRSPSWRGTHPGLGTANSLFRLSNMYLELLAVVDEGAASKSLGAQLAGASEGLAGVSFGTSDLDATVAELRERGLAVGEPLAGEARHEQTGVVRRFKNARFPSAQTRGLFAFATEHLSPADLLPPAAATAVPDACVSGLDHVVVQTQDPDASRALYRDLLGLRLALDKSFPSFAARLLFFRIGGVTVELAAKLGAAPQPSAPDIFGGLAWQVPDAAATRERLARAGFDVSELRPGRKEGTRVCTVRGETHAVPTLLIEPTPH